jgi:CubicO group peptidase (beta-lactamase class C family)
MKKPSTDFSVTETAILLVITLIIVVVMNIAAYVYVMQSNLPAQQAQSQDETVPQAATPLPVTETRLAQFATDMETLRLQYHIPGMSVGVMRGDELVFVQGFGYADVENGIPASEHTAYRIASLTKPIAAVVIMQLVEEGKINLDADLETYDPGYARLCGQLKGVFSHPYHCDTQHVSVRHHLTHTAHDTPGEAYLYNSDLYALLSRVAVNVSGQSFEQLLTNRVIQPLQMTHTAASQHSAPPHILDALARPYRTDFQGNIFPSMYPDPDVSAAAGVISTVPDLAKFSLAMDHNLLVSAETRAAMWTPTTSSSGQVLPYGLGWFVQEVEGTRLVGHYGWWPDAFSSLLLKLPERGLTLIVLANGDGASAPFEIGEYGDMLRSPFATTFIHTFTGSAVTGMNE